MGRSKKYSAFHFSEKKISAVEMAHLDDEFELLAFVEQKTSQDVTGIFSSPSSVSAEHVRVICDEISTVRRTGGFKGRNISFCLDSEWVFTHSFPMDDTLVGSEREDQVAWELSNYIGPSVVTEFVTATAALLSTLQSGTSLLLSASVKRDLVVLLRRAAALLDLDLAVIDVDHYGAEHAFLRNYPELGDKPVGLLSVRPTRLDASLIVGRKPVRYRWKETSDASASGEFIDEVFHWDSNANAPAQRLFVYGDGLNTSNLGGLGFGDSFSVELLDPLRKVNLPRAVRRMERSFFQKYAPVLGIAMREK